jgi:hypothetical protein
MVGMKLKVALGSLFAFLIAAPSALASSAQSVYGGAAGAAETQATNSGTLPFTGLDLVLLAGGGLLLVFTGVALYLISRPRTSA